MSLAFEKEGKVQQRVTWDLTKKKKRRRGNLLGFVLYCQSGHMTEIDELLQAGYIHPCSHCPSVLNPSVPVRLYSSRARVRLSLSIRFLPVRLLASVHPSPNICLCPSVPTCPFLPARPSEIRRLACMTRLRQFFVFSFLLSVCLIVCLFVRLLVGSFIFLVFKVRFLSSDTHCVSFLSFFPLFLSVFLCIINGCSQPHLFSLPGPRSLPLLCALRMKMFICLHGIGGLFCASWTTLTTRESSAKN